MIYSADFETTKNEDGSMRVWLADVCAVDDLTHRTFTSIDQLMMWVSHQRTKTTLYFHNLKFDGQYIVCWLDANGYTYAEKPKLRGEYNILVTDKSQWFCGKICMKKGKVLEIKDSLKKIPLSVKQMAKAYGLPMSKGEIDYTAPRTEGYLPTEEEIDYVRRDTEIVARVLKIHFDQGMTKLTAPADAIANYQTMIDFDTFFVSNYWISHPGIENFCRKAYCGGISWVNPDIKEMHCAGGKVYDYNSMYPSVMLAYPMPIGYPVEFYGEPLETHPLYIAKCNVNITRKPGHLASVRDPAEKVWIEDTYEGEIYLTNADVEIIRMNYYGDIEIISGYCWRGVRGVFDEYIKFWGDIKRNAKKGDPMRQLAKLMLNSLYGKFGTNPQRQHKIPVFYEQILHWKLSEVEKGRPYNVAVAAFITAYARLELSKGANACGYLAYVDTDSLHILDTADSPAWFDGKTHDSDFGAWKLESTFKRAKYLRQKTYIEETEEGYNIAACGCPESSKKYINFDNFEIGATFPGKLRPVARRGGCELVECDFTIRAPLSYYGN